MKNRNLILTSILGALTVILGAFGSHVLKEKLGVEGLETFETAVKYQMYHVIVLLVVNSMIQLSIKSKNNISLFFFLGILFFSGSLYLITIFGVNPKNIWFVTPLGGLFFILGWLRLLYYLFKGK
jgi:uncharacterized membrane protein YgdD (TMEM256/DUF423 family)|tara:strand:+ start:252 stop:626 length:375 start_codon:yes stop_codon:yes gene_type:complete